MRKRISAHVVNIFMKIVSILNGLVSPIFYIRILIKIIMVCVRAVLIIKALEYEFK